VFVCHSVSSFMCVCVFVPFVCFFFHPRKMGDSCLIILTPGIAYYKRTKCDSALYRISYKKGNDTKRVCNTFLGRGVYSLVCNTFLGWGESTLLFFNYLLHPCTCACALLCWVSRSKLCEKNIDTLPLHIFEEIDLDEAKKMLKKL